MDELRVPIGEYSRLEVRQGMSFESFINTKLQEAGAPVTGTTYKVRSMDYEWFHRMTPTHHIFTWKKKDDGKAI